MNKNTKKDKMIAEEKEMDILREITMEAEMEYEMEWMMEWMMEGMTIIQERKLNEYDQGQKSQEG